jgi:hypothetical protein
MGRDNNTFEKMQRERLKKQKADDKRARRKKRKEIANEPENTADEDPDSAPAPARESA